MPTSPPALTSLDEKTPDHHPPRSRTDNPEEPSKTSTDSARQLWRKVLLQERGNAALDLKKLLPNRQLTRFPNSSARHRQHPALVPWVLELRLPLRRSHRKRSRHEAAGRTIFPRILCRWESNAFVRYAIAKRGAAEGAQGTAGPPQPWQRVVLV